MFFKANRFLNQLILCWILVFSCSTGSTQALSTGEKQGAGSSSARKTHKLPSQILTNQEGSPSCIRRLRYWVCIQLNIYDL